MTSGRPANIRSSAATRSHPLIPGGKELPPLSKREAVILLLRTRDDHAMRLKANRVYRSAPKGAAPSARKSCPDCQALKVNWPCDRCKSRGWLLFDTYTEKYADDSSILSGSSGDSRQEKRQQVDQKIAQLAQEWGDHREAPSDPLTKACEMRDAMDRNGSYRELRACLHLLADANSFWCAALTSMYGADEGFRDITASFQAAAEQGLELVLTWMPDPVRVPAWLTPAAQAFAARQTKRSAA